MTNYCNEHSRIDERLKGLEQRQLILFNKLDRLLFWVVGIAGGVAMSCILIAVNIIMREAKGP